MCRPEVICGSPTSCEGESRHSEVRHPDGTFSAICRSPPDASFRSWIRLVSSVAVLPASMLIEHAFSEAQQSTHRNSSSSPCCPWPCRSPVLCSCSARALLVLCSCSARAQVVLRSRRGRDFPPPTTPPPPSPITDPLRRSLTRPTRRSGSAPRHWVGICALRGSRRPSEPQPTQ